MSERDTMTTIWRSPRSQWLLASAAAVHGYDPIRADLWREMAREMERAEHHMRHTPQKANYQWHSTTNKQPSA